MKLYTSVLSPFITVIIQYSTYCQSLCTYNRKLHTCTTRQEYGARKYGASYSGGRGREGGGEGSSWKRGGQGGGEKAAAGGEEDKEGKKAAAGGEEKKEEESQKVV